MDSSSYNSKNIAELTSELSNRKIPNRSKLTTREKKIKVLIFHDKNPSPKQLSDYINSLLDDDSSKKRKELTSSTTSSSPKKIKSKNLDSQDEEMSPPKDEVDELVDTIDLLKVSKTSYLIMIDIANKNPTTLVYTDKSILMDEIKKFIKQFYKVSLSNKWENHFDVILKSSGLRLPNDDTLHVYSHHINPIMKLKTCDLPKADNYPSYEEFL